MTSPSRKETKPLPVQDDFKLVEFSFVRDCIYRGSDLNLDESGVHPITGEVCNHPGKMKSVKP